MSKQGEFAVRHQTVLDEHSLEILKRVQYQAIRFMSQPPPSLSNLIRYAIGLLDVEASVWDDLGEPDKAEVRRLMTEARRCRKAQTSTTTEGATPTP